MKLAQHIFFACWSVFAGMGLCLADEAARPDENAYKFDIPAQPLNQAVSAFAIATGQSALVDEAQFFNRTSKPVHGELTAKEAAKVMLAGTGLSMHIIGEGRFTLNDERDLMEHSGKAGSPDDSANAFFSDLQLPLALILCNDPLTRPGSYQAALQLWLRPDGRIRAVHILDSSGNSSLDLRIRTILAGAYLLTPPTGLPQPVTVSLARMHDNTPWHCEAARP
jgi:hypothetical protein